MDGNAAASQSSLNALARDMRIETARCEHQSNRRATSIPSGRLLLVFAMHELPCGSFVKEIITPVDEISSDKMKMKSKEEALQQCTHITP